MPEGDSVWKLARRLDRQLSGRRVVTSDFRTPRLATRDLSGREVLGHDTHGKHLLTRFSALDDGGVTLHSHLRLDGSWVTTAPGKRLPARLMPHVRLVLAVDDGQTTYGVKLHDLDLAATDDEDRFVGHLGPDPLRDDWDAAEAVRRLSADPTVPLVTALLDQRSLAGLGNLWVNELAFLTGVSPWTPIGEVDVVRLVDRAATMLQHSATVPQAYQVTTGSMWPGTDHWVTGRQKRGCLRCRTAVRMVEEIPNDPGNRRTWWCPSCQPGPGPETRRPTAERDQLSRDPAGCRRWGATPPRPIAQELSPRMATKTRLGPLRLVAAGLLAGAVLAAPGGGAEAAPAAQAAPLSPYLAQTLPTLTGKSMVMVHGATLADATRAVRAAGLARVTTFDKIGVVVARGTKAQIQAVRTQAGVTYVEGNQPIEFLDDTSNTATRGVEAAQTLTGADGTALTGRGVSVAVIDSGVDPTHPAFAEADGSSAVVANLKTLCDPFEAACTVQALPNVVDTDTLSVGGHGTHVNGIVAGRPTELADGTTQAGAATDAKLVSISTGAGIVIIGADAALNWVLENHAAPCGAGVPAAECPPIKVTNNSYGPSGGGEFDPNSATVKLQRQLAAEGVVTVWANGNDGGDGSDEPVEPAGHGPDRRHHLRRVLLRPEHRHP